MNKISILILAAIFFSNIGFGQNYIFSKQEIQEDLSFLQTQLIEKHPNIEVYTPSKTFLDFFQNISIPDSVSQIEAYSIITSTNAVILDGHTQFFPNQNFINTNNESGLFLPIQPFWDGERLYILKNYSQSLELTVGAEILSIDGVNSTALVKEMLIKMMSDGNNLSYPIWVLNNYFFEYYSYFYGTNKNYQLGIKENEKNKSVNLQGISKNEWLQKLNTTNENGGKGISLELDKENNIAILTIKDWHNSILRRKYKQKFKPEIKKIMQQVENNRIEHLIIDVRNNQGGDLNNSKYLLSYLLRDPFLLVEGYNKKKKGIVVKTKGPQMGIHKPSSTTFKGNVYVLTNGGSFSNTGIFCSALKRYKRAAFIGEQTGGSEFILSGNPKMIKLSNTGIQIEIPRLQFLIKTSSNGEKHGIMPDLEIMPTIKDLIDGTDVIIESTKKMIKNKANN